MAKELTSLCKTLKYIRTYLVKIGPERRKGNKLSRKVDETNVLDKRFPEILTMVNKKIQILRISETELSVIKELSK